MAKLRDFLQLNEGVENKYWPMMEAVFKIESSSYEQPDMVNDLKKQIVDLIKEASSVLRRKDRVVWFLRWYRFARLITFIENLETRMKWQDVEEANEKRKSIHDLAMKLKTKLEQQFMMQGKVSFSVLSQDQNLQYPKHVLNIMEHYLTLPIPEIQNYRFDWQPPSLIIDEFELLEEEWKSQRQGTLIADEDDEPIIKFPDGFVWFNLNKAYCSKEAEAMGHCGNAPRQTSSDTVLSLRKVISEEEGLYKPHLTFILDDNRYLGEMKGRGNDKPSEKYHPYIIELLKHPMIKGIKGGGYLPEHNFSMNDLPDEIRVELEEMKPGLKGPVELIREMFREGLSGRAMDRLSDLLYENGVSFRNFGLISENTVRLMEYDLQEFVSNINDRPPEVLIELYNDIDNTIDVFEREGLNIELDTLKNDIGPVIEKLIPQAKEKLFNYFGLEWERGDFKENEKIGFIVQKLIENEGGVYQAIVGNTFLSAAIISLIQQDVIEEKWFDTGKERLVDYILRDPIHFLNLYKDQIKSHLVEYLEAGWPMKGNTMAEVQNIDDPISANILIMIDLRYLLDMVEAYLSGDEEDIEYHLFQELQGKGDADDLLDYDALVEIRSDNALEDDIESMDLSDIIRFDNGPEVWVNSDKLSLNDTQIASIMQDLIMHNVRESKELDFFASMLFEEDILRGLT